MAAIRPSHRSPCACLLARRMVERGVRFINIITEGWTPTRTSRAICETIAARPTKPPRRSSRT
jgi:hypothetical protein